MEDFPGSEGMLDIYLYESFQLLEQMEAIVLSDQGGDFFGREDINEIFRVLHTIKGSAGLMMYDNISAAAHKLEDIFYYLRETYTEAVPKEELAEYIFKVSDFIQGEFGKIKKGSHPDGNPDDIIESVDRYVNLLKSGIQEKGGELPPANEYIAPGQFYIAPVTSSSEPLIIDLGDYPVAEEAAGPEVCNDTKVSKVIVEAGQKHTAIIGVSDEEIRKIRELTEALLQMEEDEPEKTDWGSIKGKFVGHTQQILAIATEMSRVSLTAVFRKMHRIVCDIAKKTGKSIEVQAKGGLIEADRNVVEHISEALLHIVRNAADHGIEDKQKRAVLGKPPKGKIILEASIDSGELCLMVKDDGKGLNKKDIFYKARQCGLIKADQTISDFTDEEIYRFITLPGFSTKDSVSEYSGRGVGLDVAAKRIEEIGGRIIITGKAGTGTSIMLKVPVKESRQDNKI